MAIQPIDLQTLFSQMDKVGKSQAELKEGAQMQQALVGAANQKKLDDRVRSVNETRDPGDGPEKVKDRPPKRGGDKGSRKKDGKKDEDEHESSEIVRDPDLGRNVDLSG
ncbi:MAG: hypothetical protein A2Z99_05885 [Treponema sp. GWB1_62_6]|nr:MAG: hypothetical protein A2001_01075 [Treponema sp. GWC1_61_84]OHE65166.1 MAG: hypothetical protein A2Y36_17145 [Treponema sp. GWA1_62_8]OHE72050.1 MAG: hypothetical protein A2Z99_05885 [Treponema sp. GWB1_62_6]OHE74645.1 MAG: hypothetical protein A2413_19045 [Treponema sp. RIFOXYC1_FULL_61_9]HCM27967.1 hypothetical protein [Treponema sp.]